MTPDEMRAEIVRELDVILAEMAVPGNTGLIPRSLTRHLRDWVAAWPNILVMGQPLVQP